MKLAHLCLAVVIVILAVSVNRAGSRERRNSERKKTPIGVLTVTEGSSQHLERGTQIALPIEGTIGSARSCDTRVRHPDVPKEAVSVSMSPNGMVFSPSRWNDITVDGQDYDEPVAVSSGSVLTWGDLSLSVEIFGEAKPERKTTNARAKRNRSKANSEEDNDALRF